ncbi:MAG: Hsp20 family protein [Elusimicrobia bacterium]|nr:Hsp20 family protein [Elusimicrobiota bacterium]
MRYLTIREPERGLREFDGFFGGIFDDFRRSMKAFGSAFAGNELELKEEKDKYVVSGELKDYGKKDLKVTVDDNVLYVKAEKKSEDRKTKETSYSSYSRVLYLGDNADAKKITASFKKGKLSIEIPKTKEPVKKVTEVTIQ